MRVRLSLAASFARIVRQLLTETLCPCAASINAGPEQLAFTVTLLVAAGLLANGFVRLNRVDHCFSASNMFTVAVDLPRSRLTGKVEINRFLDEWRRRTATVPGVRAVTISESIPPHLGFHMCCAIAPSPRATHHKWPSSPARQNRQIFLEPNPVEHRLLL